MIGRGYSNRCLTAWPDGGDHFWCIGTDITLSLLSVQCNAKQQEFGDGNDVIRGLE
jgi:hypothetical protein